MKNKIISVLHKVLKMRKTQEYPQEYYYVLKNIHKSLKPHKYLEIGIRCGHSLSLAEAKTHCIGIDPEPQISEKINKNTEIF